MQRANKTNNCTISAVYQTYWTLYYLNGFFVSPKYLNEETMFINFSSIHWST